MDDFITATRKIKISYSKGDDKEECIESKIIVSTTAGVWDKVNKTSNVRIYFFINKDGSESSCFEFDPFSPSITFDNIDKKKKKRYFLFSKTISDVTQKITINKQDENEEEEDGDELDSILEDLFNKRNK